MRFIGVLLLIWFFCGKNFAQKPVFIGLDYLVGKSINHTEKFKPELTGFTNTINLSIGKQSDTSKNWQKRWKLPDFGAGLIYQSNTSRQYFGTTYAFYGFTTLPIIPREKWRISHQIGYGIAYASKHFDEQKNPENNVIGSAWNVYLDLRFFAEINVHKHLTLNVGAGFNHFSNGGVHKPNLGLNTPYAQMGLKYRFVPATWQKIKKDSIPKPERRHEYFFRFGTGIGQIRGYGTAQYPIYAASIGYGYDTSAANKVMGGIIMEHDARLRDFNLVTGEDTTHVVSKPFTCALFIADEMMIGRFALHYEAGLYLRHPSFKVNPVYIKAGPTFYLPPLHGKHSDMKAFLGTYVKTYWGTAQMMEFCLGMTFN